MKFAILYRTDTGEILDVGSPGHRWDALRAHPQASIAEVEVGDITMGMLKRLRYVDGELKYQTESK